MGATIELCSPKSIADGIGFVSHTWLPPGQAETPYRRGLMPYECEYLAQEMTKPETKGGSDPKDISCRADGGRSTCASTCDRHEQSRHHRKQSPEARHGFSLGGSPSQA